MATRLKIDLPHMERTLITVPNAIPMVAVVGPHDANLRTIEAAFPSVNITVRGNEITLRGPHDDCAKLENLFNELMVVIRSGNILNVDAVSRAIEMLEHKPADHPAEVMSLNIVSNRGRTIRPKTANQKRYVDAIEDHTITFGIGPAGTGKTYLAMAMAVAALNAKKINRIILTRPAVEAGEHLGFLPGTLSEKIDPYLRPLFDALHDMIDIDSIPRLMQSGVIEVAPLAYMRGRTLNDAFVILDEAQNTTPEQMKMFLTRLGFGSKMVVTGDVTQIDLPNGQNSGLRVIRDILKDIDDIAFLELTAEDVVRHRLIGDIVRAYDKFDEQRQALRPIRK
jgi:phosphate starvation-inducible protein PhoH and related proteins